MKLLLLILRFYLSKMNGKPEVYQNLDRVRTPFPILFEYLLIKRKVKKLINEIIDKRLSDIFSAGIIYFEFLYLIFLP